MSDRTVAEDTLTPGASTTCWDPTGCDDSMYSVTTALRTAALRESSSADVRGAPSGCLSSLVAMSLSEILSSRSAPGGGSLPGACRR